MHNGSSYIMFFGSFVFVLFVFFIALLKVAHTFSLNLSTLHSLVIASTSSFFLFPCFIFVPFAPFFERLLKRERESERVSTQYYHHTYTNHGPTKVVLENNPCPREIIRPLRDSTNSISRNDGSPHSTIAISLLLSSFPYTHAPNPKRNKFTYHTLLPNILHFGLEL